MELVYPDKSKNTKAEVRDGNKLIAKLRSGIHSDRGTALFVVDPKGKLRLMTTSIVLNSNVRLTIYKACEKVVTLPVVFKYYSHQSTYANTISLHLSFDNHRYGFSVRSDVNDENRIKVNKTKQFGQTLDELYRLFDTGIVTRSIRQFFKQKEEERYV